MREMPAAVTKTQQGAGVGGCIAGWTVKYDRERQKHWEARNELNTKKKTNW